MILVLGTYGQGGTEPKSLRALASQPPDVAPGGIAASGGRTTIYPSCCCGLEDWRSWLALFEDGPSPWLGHDPAPWVERSGDGFTIWADGGLGEPDSGPPERIVVPRSTLARELATIEATLNAFSARLGDVLSERGDVASATAIATWFRRTFVGPSRSVRFACARTPIR